MTRRERILARAAELDDVYPDEICPGCGQDINGWWRWAGHQRRPGQYRRPSRPGRFIWVAQVTYSSERWLCPWTTDYLSARLHRRRLLAEAAESAVRSI